MIPYHRANLKVFRVLQKLKFPLPSIPRFHVTSVFTESFITYSKCIQLENLF